MKLEICDLKTGKIFNEKVCAETFMRFLYHTKLGRFATFALFKRAMFSRICGAWAASNLSRKAVWKFIEQNGIDITEMQKSPSDFKCFNDFFTRAIRTESRPLALSGNRKVISFPSDGRHLLIKNVNRSDSFYAKGSKFNLDAFLGDAKLARRFDGGSMLISRLSPLDYHRFHYPISGVIVARKLIKGHLFSVSPLALAPRLSIFWENRRILNIVDSEEFGMCAFVEIGATNVGSIVNFHEIGSIAERGEAAGMFNFGGSCIVTLFPASDKIKWNAVLEEMSAKNIECYARVNELVGVLQ